MVITRAQFHDTLLFVTKLTWVTFLCAYVFEALFPGFVTVQVRLAFFLYIAILSTVALYVETRLIKTRTH